MHEMLRVPKAFTDKFPNYHRSQELFDKYLCVIRGQLLKRLPFLNDQYTYLPLHDMHEACGEFQFKNKRYYVFSEFRNLKGSALFTVDENEKGNGKKHGKNYQKNSRVLLMNQQFINLLIDTGDVDQFIQMYYQDIDVLDTQVVDRVPIDKNSLENFINTTKRTLDNVEFADEYSNRLHSNLRQALYIRLICNYYSEQLGEYALPQVKQKSVYGRMYYRGMNIQNVTREVRNACLGDHVMYDLNAAVYAIKLNLAHEFITEMGENFTGLFTYTKEYLDSKDPIRHKLAKHITAYSNPLKLVKEAMTAIGFGARISGGSWQADGEWQSPAIDQIIMNADDRKRFENDPWINEFKVEQVQMTKFIAHYWLLDPLNQQTIAQIPDALSLQGKPRLAKVISYLFQNTEYQVLEHVTVDLPVIARIHDSFICKRALTVDQLITVKQKLKEWGPYLSIDETTHTGWRDPVSMDEEQLHMLRIEQEELLAEQTLGLKHRAHVKKRAPVAAIASDSRAYDGGVDWGTRSIDLYDNDTWNSLTTRAQKQEYCRVMGVSMPDSVAATTPDFIQQLLKQ